MKLLRVMKTEEASKFLGEEVSKIWFYQSLAREDICYFLQSLLIGSSWILGSLHPPMKAWLAEFEKWWGRNNEAALVVRPTLRVQSNAEIPRAHGQRIMCDL